MIRGSPFPRSQEDRKREEERRYTVLPQQVLPAACVRMRYRLRSAHDDGLFPLSPPFPSPRFQLGEVGARMGRDRGQHETKKRSEHAREGEEASEDGEEEWNSERTSRLSIKKKESEKKSLLKLLSNEVTVIY